MTEKTRVQALSRKPDSGHDHNRDSFSAAPARPWSQEQTKQAGNLALQHLLQSGVIQASLKIGSPDDPLEREADAAAERCAHGVPCGPSAVSCGGCRHQLIQRKIISTSETAIHPIPLTSLIIQPKLAVSQPGDPFEQETDHAAETAVSAQTAGRCEGTTCPSGGCSVCHHPIAIHRKAMPSTNAPAAPAAISGALHSGGRPLDPPVRAAMETALGADFSSVRVHTDQRAAESAQSIQALAYTAGSDVVFGTGRYAPETTDGRQLLAHELAHVVQQSYGQYSDRQSPEPAARQEKELPAENTPGFLKKDTFAQDESTATPPPMPSVQSPFVVNRLPSSPSVLQIQRYTDASAPGIAREWRPGGIYYEAPVPSRLWGRNDEGLPPAGENVISGNYIGLDTVELSESVEFNKAQLTRLIALRGFPAGWDVVNSLTRERENAADESGVSRINAVMRSANQAMTELENERRELIAVFEHAAKAIAADMLDSSWEKVNGEIERLGISSDVTHERGSVYHGEPLDRPVTTFSMTGEESVNTALQEGAQRLLEARRSVEETRGSISGLERPPYSYNDRENTYRSRDYESRSAELHSRLESALSRYNTVRDEEVPRNPVLALYADLAKSSSGLETIAEEGSARATAGEIGPQLFEIRNKINTVRNGLRTQRGNENVNVWRLPNVVQRTVDLLGLGNDAYAMRIINENVNEEAPGLLIQMALSILDVLGFLLAEPTGGLSVLVLSVPANAVLAGMEISRYLEQATLFGTAMSPEEALVSEEPSLVGPALAVSGLVLTAGGALLQVGTTAARMTRLSQINPELNFSSRLRLANVLSSHPELANYGWSITELRAEAERLGLSMSDRELNALINFYYSPVEEAGIASRIIPSWMVEGESQSAWREILLDDLSPEEMDLVVDVLNAENVIIGRSINIRGRGMFLFDNWLQTRGIEWNQRWQDIFNKAIFERTAQGSPVYVMAGGGYTAGEVLAAEEGASESGILNLPYWPDTGPVLPPPIFRRLLVPGSPRYNVESLEGVRYLRANPPVRPEGLDEMGGRLWDDYVLYYNNRLDDLGAQLQQGAIRSEPPRTWESYRAVREGEFGLLSRGRAHQTRVTGSMADLDEELLTESDVGVSRVAQPGTGQVRYADQLIMDRADRSLTAVSNKSRNFLAHVEDYTQAELETLRQQVRRDVNELFEKYSGQLYIRRQSHPLYGNQVNIREVILIYENNAGLVNRDLAEIIMSVARQQARANNPAIAFHVSLQ